MRNDYRTTIQRVQRRNRPSDPSRANASPNARWLPRPSRSPHRPNGGHHRTRLDANAQRARDYSGRRRNVRSRPRPQRPNLVLHQKLPAAEVPSSASASLPSIPCAQDPEAAAATTFHEQPAASSTRQIKMDLTRLYLSDLLLLQARERASK